MFDEVSLPAHVGARTTRRYGFVPASCDDVGLLWLLSALTLLAATVLTDCVAAWLRRSQGPLICARVRIPDYPPTDLTPA